MLAAGVFVLQVFGTIVSIAFSCRCPVGLSRAYFFIILTGFFVFNGVRECFAFQKEWRIFYSIFLGMERWKLFYKHWLVPGLAGL